MADRTTQPAQDERTFQLPALSFDSGPISPLSSPSLVHRPGYQRITSHEVSPPEEHKQSAGRRPTVDSVRAEGLAISNLPLHREHSMTGSDLDNRSDETIRIPADSVTSPMMGRVDDYDSFGGNDDELKHARTMSFASSLHQPFLAVPDTERLTPRSPASTMGSHEPLMYDSSFACKSKRNVARGRRYWFSIVILVLSIYSTIFSAIWLVVAAHKPRYGELINTTSGRLSPINASILFAAIAKSIELSFVTVFVAFLGQVLSRRAFAVKSSGISIAEMSARSWVMQPGTMITNFGNVRFAGRSILGILSLAATAVAIFYTTASDTLDAPKLKLGPVEERTLYGRVSSPFANATYIANNCQTPVSSMDRENSPESCIEIEHAGQAFHSFMQYMGVWASNIDSGKVSADLKKRPLPVGMLYDNTTVQGSWISVSDMPAVSQKYGRIVNNVTMAMPHSGVFAAAMEPLNQIMQPQDFDGLGQFHIGASVPSPTVNVLCVEVKKAELAPLVYTEWPAAAMKPFNVSTWPREYDLPRYPDWLEPASKGDSVNFTNYAPRNVTPIDDIFGFGKNYDRRPPIFAKFPTPYNTILNTTNQYVDTLYVLATGATGDHTLCSISASLTTNCSTLYNASISGGSMTSRCEDPNDPLQYSKSYPNATNGQRSKDWVTTAFHWAYGVNLNGGISDGNDSIARLLTQLISTTPALNASLPSFAEALAVLSGCSLLISSIGTPFVHFWNYTKAADLSENPQLQQFPATLRFQDYASGGDQPWQNVFFIILVLAFLLNFLCLAYFGTKRGLVTDFVEPQNLFALAINSPPSRQLAGSCGGGPEDEQLRSKWHIGMDHDHFYIAGKSSRVEPTHASPAGYSEFTCEDSPFTRSYSELSRKRRSIL
ncbi:hypothetical protein MMC30_005871 [Trapelia coarctata]|nr:hypothetical protein [Trapelia coarctata]